MAIVIVCTLCIINLFLWCLFFIKFNKLFSTDDIIENTRTELNKMLLDVNRNAERNITLIESRIKDLKDVITEADAHLLVIKSEAERRTLESVYQAQINSAISSNQKSVNTRIEKAYKKNQPKIDYNSTVELSQKSLLDNAQNSLFNVEDTANDQSEQILKQEIPVLANNVFMTQNPIEIKKDFNAQVQERYQKGETVEEIATALSRSITEVQFALDMNV